MNSAQTLRSTYSSTHVTRRVAVLVVYLLPLFLLLWAAGAQAQTDLWDALRDAAEDVATDVMPGTDGNESRPEPAYEPPSQTPAAPAASQAPGYPPDYNHDRRKVAKAQALLNRLGYDAGTVDGLYGPSTRGAIVAYQADRGLPRRGDVTPALLSRLMAEAPRTPAATAPTTSRVAEAAVRSGRQTSSKHSVKPLQTPAQWYGPEYQQCTHQTTVDLTACVRGQTRNWERRLSQACQKLSATLATATQRQQLQKAQRLWFEYRDANCGFYGAGRGSIGRIKVAECQRVMTKKRARELMRAASSSAGAGAEPERPARGTRTAAATATATHLDASPSSPSAPSPAASAGAPRPPETAETDSVAAPLEYFYDDTTLYAFQPGHDPVAVATVDTKLHTSYTTMPVPLFEGTRTHWQPAYVFYQRTDGSFARVSTDHSIFPPLPEQVSSLVLSRPVCATTGQDLADSGAAPIVVAVLNPGTKCGDSDRRPDYMLIHAGADATTPASAFPEPQTGTLGSIIGLLGHNLAHIGWLIRQDDKLMRVSADDRTVTPVLSGGTPVAVTESFGPLINYFRGVVVGERLLMLRIDDHLWAYDATANTITNLDYEFHDKRVNAVGRLGGELYFVDDNALWRTRGGGTKAPIKLDAAKTPLEPPGNAQPRNRLALGADHVAWTFASNGGTVKNASDDIEVLRVVPAMATMTGTGTTLDTVATGTAAGGFHGELVVLAQRVFYNVILHIETGLPADLPVEEARSASLDGYGVEATANARWLNLGYFDPFLGDSLYRLEGMTFTNLAGDALVAVPAGDLSAAITIGTIPADALGIFIGLGAGPGRLARIMVHEKDGQIRGDILYFDAARAHSLQRITDTPKRDETPAFGF